MSKFLEAVKAAQDLETVEVEVPEWGITVELREPSAGVALAARKKFTDSKTGVVDAEKAVWVTLAVCLVEDGELVFANANEAKAALSGKGQKAIKRIINACEKLIDTTVEDAEKN